MVSSAPTILPPRRVQSQYIVEIETVIDTVHMQFGACQKWKS